MDFASTISFLIVSAGLAIAPGPDILFVFAKSVAAGTRTGILVACGLVSGTLVHTTLAALGISLLIKNSPFAFGCVKWLGVAYLCFLGAKSLMHFREVPLPENSEKIAPESAAGTPISLFRQGVLMSVLNPKLILFFLAIFPQFLPENSSNVPAQTFGYGIIFALVTLFIFCAVAIFSGSVSVVLRERPKVVQILNIFTALVLFGIALSVAIF